MLDTNVCVDLIRGRPPGMLRRFEEHEVGEVGISSVTAAELQFGVQKSRQPGRNARALERFLLPLEVAGFDRDTAAVYGNVRATLERRGTSIGPLDTLIAAHAVSLGVTLVTNNVREFGRVPDLRLENWVGE